MSKPTDFVMDMTHIRLRMEDIAHRYGVPLLQAWEDAFTHPEADEFTRVVAQMEIDRARARLS